ncbi:MAG: patatin-like phospholipase family protein [Tepidimonas sp.]|uniref:patatin-like phospholipase family protein n=1 Tax=Tepidimonas sp. TaxID=2002775 RepID=UPI00259F8247|nr:patatin-like phospholipase family protein [Tepidimonas sp.]MDM7457548.1 patatin-like phospholipase family protein [Tepidimonas sp.]
MTAAAARPRIGLALGSGAARGWAHIGVLRVLQEAGLQPDIVCGTSIGALVGAAYAAGELDRLEPWVRSLGWREVVGLIDLRFGGGLIEGDKLEAFFRSRFVDGGIEALRKPFGCVATDLVTGREVWLRQGPVIDAVRASIAIPGVFTPAQLGGRLLVDGGLVNPVPVSLARAMGAEFVIAVDLNWDLMRRRQRVTSRSRGPRQGVLQAVLQRLRGHAQDSLDGAPVAPQEDAAVVPSILDVLTTSMAIVQWRITQSRLAGEPADIVIRPALADVAAMDFHRAAPAIAAGRRAAEQSLSVLSDALAMLYPESAAPAHPAG